MDAAGRDASRLLLETGVIGQRVEQGVEADADTVTHVGRAKQRQHQIHAFARTPDRESLTEILSVAFKAHGRGDIEDAGYADGAVDHEPADGFNRPIRLSLQDIASQGHGCVQGFEDPAHGVLDLRGKQIAIKHGQGLEQQALDKLVEGEDRPVHGFERIVDAITRTILHGRRRTSRHHQNSEQGADCAGTQVSAVGAKKFSHLKHCPS